MSLNLLKYFRRNKKSVTGKEFESAEAHNTDGTHEEIIDIEDSSSKNNSIVMENTNMTTPEFAYLENLISYRLGFSNKPEFPDVNHWSFPLKKYVVENELDADAATLLLIGLVPHAFPELFDQAIQEKIKTSGDFPEIGGVRGKNFRGFLPTGQTAIFLLAGNDWERRLKVEQLFWSNGEFAMKKILWLEDLPHGEPIMSGKITMALDYVNLFLYGTSAPPHFSTSFPAKKITTELTTGGIMMNKEVKRHYKHLKDWFKHNPALMKDWGMDTLLRQGFRVLFYGPSGTGKTLTAKVLGNETGKHVYRIDLSMVVSKYIGETEKNLEMIFARAEEKDWILFFDEADAIFGKRTNVRDAHDKYANQEVSYLLQRIEDFNGLIILATNMKTNIDTSFLRRFDDVVKFSVPSEEERKEIWEKSFPKNADCGTIPDQIKKYELTGGNIINIVHFAGIQALRRKEESLKTQEVYSTPCGDDWMEPNPAPDKADSQKLKFYLDDVIEGIKREMIKEGKPFSG